MARRMCPKARMMAVRLLCEGNSLRSVGRVIGSDKKTIGKVILQFGQAAKNFLDDNLRDLELGHVEIDEVWSFVAKKQARLTLDERATRHDIGDVYLWTAIDRDTKLIASHLVGKRSADNARRLMVDLASRINMPTPHASDNHAYELRTHKPVIQISTDGLAAYPEAIDLAFGPYASHGVLIKEYKNARMAYDPSEMVGTQRNVIRGNISERTICTSHIERHNLTVRTFMKRFTRLSLGFSKKLECHEAAIAMFLAYYNFVWRTRYPDQSGKRGQLRPTAAMMAGVIDELWNFSTFYDEVNQYEGVAAW